MQLTLYRKHDLEIFDPEQYRLHDAALDYGIEEAKRIRNWPALEEAVDRKIAEAGKFVAWWRTNVRGPGGDHSCRSALMGCAEAEAITGMRQYQVSRLGKNLIDTERTERFRLQLLGAAYRAAMFEAAHVRGTFGTGEYEWFTPPEYIRLARKVLGEIDLDPATHEQAQANVRALHYYTSGDDGLAREWHGRIFLNPPYAEPLIGRFVNKLAEEWGAGHITSAIVLTNSYTDTSWFQQMARLTSAICFTRGRIRFFGIDGGDNGRPTQGQAFFYFGNDTSKFEETFAEVGFVVIPLVAKKDGSL